MLRLFSTLHYSFADPSHPQGLELPDTSGLPNAGVAGSNNKWIFCVFHSHNLPSRNMESLASYDCNLHNIHFFFNLCGGTSGIAATYWPIVPAPDDR
jgi:hypothetical protein